MTRLSRLHSNDWWSQLRLRYQGLALISCHEHRIEEVVLAVLREHPPVAFADGVDSPPHSRPGAG